MKAIKSDFRNFLFLCWKHLSLPEPTPIQYDIASFMQSAPKRSVIQAFRGVGKSWICSAFVCWKLLNNPNLKFLVVSASKNRADDFSTFTKRLINEMEILVHLSPRDNQRGSNVSFDVAPAKAAHAPSVKSVGITGQLTGSRADFIISDDCESLNNSLTQSMRDKLSDNVKEFEAVLSPNGKIMFLGTPQSEMSIYNELGLRGYETMIWTARKPKVVQIKKYSGNLAPFVVNNKAKEGEPIDPIRFNKIDLEEREASYGRSGFSLQFMLDTTLSDKDRYPLKLSDFVVMDINNNIAPVTVAWAGSSEYACEDLPSVGFTGDKFYKPMFTSEDFTDYTGSVMSLDPSGRGKDELGIAIVKQLGGNLYVQKCTGISGGYNEDNLQLIAREARNAQVNKIIVERNFGDGMFTQLLKPVVNKYYPVSIEEVNHSKQKELRIIDTLEPVLNQHKLIVSPQVIREDFDTKDANYQLFHQLTRITKDRGSLRNDDRLDALAIAVAYWIETMAVDTDRQLQDHRDRLVKTDLDRFMSSALGTRPKEDNWIT
ncbi:MAG: DNA maturase B [Parcubacteria group bacterium]|jgi:hypothetical protein|nr:DNA maturase B [Parcubacteria group bacterium]|tara:strand:- start:11521 stop:13149 length:1629 start_codon:yes stop_codon:yes gene_type:complete